MAFVSGKKLSAANHAPRRGSRIDRLPQTPEPGFSFLNPFHNHQEVSKRARKSVEAQDNENIARPQLVQQSN
jgi:hypothetical protein